MGSKRPRMSIFFAILSVAYIAGIFLFAGSPIVSAVNSYNPYSLLHIPLYGILSLFIALSIITFRVPYSNRPNKWMSPPIEAVSLSITRLLISGSIATGVGIADEIYQSFLPNRSASLIDVLLDFLGTTLALLFILQRYKK